MGTKLSIPKSNSSQSEAYQDSFVDPFSDYKIVLFGAPKVGKTSIIKRFIRGIFNEQYVPTIEDAYKQVISYNKQVFSLQIIDTSGSHQFPAMRTLSIETGNAFVLVYSVQSRASLDELYEVYDDIVRSKPHPTNTVPVILVGNKCEDAEDKEVSTECGQHLANEWKCAFIETSAKDNNKIKELFQELLQMDTNQLFSTVNRSQTANKSFRLLSHTRVKLNRKCDLI